jgi:hypothetical protein
MRLEQSRADKASGFTAVTSLQCFPGKHKNGRIMKALENAEREETMSFVIHLK